MPGRKSPLLCRSAAAALFFLAAAALFRTLPDCPAAFAVSAAALLTAAAAAAARALPAEAGSRVRTACLEAAAALLLLRIPFFSVATSDYTDFLLPWTRSLAANGGLRALGSAVGNYNVPYMVFLALICRLPVPPLYPIKLLSLLCELLAAVVLTRLILRLRASPVRAALLFPAVLLLPTVFLNSAVWGQCDSVYASLMLLGLLLALTEHPLLSAAAMGWGFSFKLQAVFLLPAAFPLLLTGRWKKSGPAVFVLAYLLAVLPAILAGAKPSDVLLFYVSSAGTAGSALSYNAPSVFSLRCFYGLADPAAAGKAGIAAAAFFCLVLMLVSLLRRRNLTDRGIFWLSLLLVCGLPLLLPHMHDRYFYLCDLLSLVCAFLVPETFLFAFLSPFASLLGYHAYFYGRYFLPMRFGFVALLPVLLFAGAAFFRSLRAAPPEAPAEAGPGS